MLRRKPDDVTPAAPNAARADRVAIRRAQESDLEVIRTIYNQGIEDRIATLDGDLKSSEEISAWFDRHSGRYGVLVAVESDRVVAWASLNPFSHRCAHANIADLSIYVARSCRGRGIGATLLFELIHVARQSGFSKIVLHALDRNEHGKRLYRKVGFANVGVFHKHGRLDGELVDVVAMEIQL